MLLTRDAPQSYRNQQTESEGMEKYIQVYEDAKKAEVVITHIRPNKF